MELARENALQVPLRKAMCIQSIRMYVSAVVLAQTLALQALSFLKSKSGRHYIEKIKARPVTGRAFLVSPCKVTAEQLYN